MSAELIATVVANAIVVSFWSGIIWQKVKDHDRRIGAIENNLERRSELRRQHTASGR